VRGESEKIGLQWYLLNEIRTHFDQNPKDSAVRECQACSYIFGGDTNKNSPYGVSAFKNI